MRRNARAVSRPMPRVPPVPPVISARTGQGKRPIEPSSPSAQQMGRRSLTMRSEMGQSRRFYDVRVESALPLMATGMRASQKSESCQQEKLARGAIAISESQRDGAL